MRRGNTAAGEDSGEPGVGPLGRVVVVVLDLVLVTDDLAVELVHQLIDRRVKIFGGALREDVLALDVQRDLGSLPAFLLAQLSTHSRTVMSTT